MDDILKKINPGMFRTREEFLRYVAGQKEPLDIQLTNNYAFQKVFKNKKVSKGFLMALLRLKEEEIADIEIIDPFKEGECEEEKEGILDVKIHMADGRKINLEMQNRYQSDWKERSIFYNCRMFLDGFWQGMGYGELESCIHVGILDFNLVEDGNFHHCFKLLDEKSGELYSDKLQFHVLQLKQIDKEPSEEEKELHRWARMIAADNWEVVRMSAKGNIYMEEAMDAMAQINMSPTERYLYLRRQMAKMDERSWRKSVLAEADAIRQEGETLKQEAGVMRREADVMKREAAETIQKADLMKKEAAEIIKEAERMKKEQHTEIEKTEARMSQLTRILMDENRYEDLKRSTEDKEFRKALFQKYGLSCDKGEK